MAYVVTESCITANIKTVSKPAPLTAFTRGGNTIAIHPDECIDCGVCEPECPVDAIRADTIEGGRTWVALNRKYAELWPNITERNDPPADRDDWAGREGKLALLSENPAA